MKGGEQLWILCGTQHQQKSQSSRYGGTSRLENNSNNRFERQPPMNHATIMQKIQPTNPHYPTLAD